jgi:hypothetical protein
MFLRVLLVGGLEYAATPCLCLPFMIFDGCLWIRAKSADLASRRANNCAFHHRNLQVTVPARAFGSNCAEFMFETPLSPMVVFLGRQTLLYVHV